MRLQFFGLLVTLCTAFPVLAQTTTGITTIDFVKVKDNKNAEVLSFFENNWKVNREIALKEGYIESYQLLTATPDEKGDFDILLITVYPDSTAYARREERFGKIIQEVAASRPKTTGGPNPRELFEIKFAKRLQTVAAGSSRSRK